MNPEFIHSLTTTCLALSASSLFVMLGRRPMRQWFGSSIAYGIWAVVPLATIATLMPALPIPHTLAVVVSPVRDAALVAQAMSGPTGSRTATVTAVWGLGALVLFTHFLMQHHRFVGSLGPLDRRRRIAVRAHSGTHDIGPLLLGLWRPLIVVPSNFRRQYTARERRLILAHERIHLRRHDPVLNLICAGLQCVFWFDPLVHIAARMFRLDQELACDDLVLRRHRGMPKSYANAILKGQTTSSRTAFACHWIPTHPLKERFMELQRTPVSSAHRVFGKTLVGMVAVSGACGTWAAQSDVLATGPTKNSQTYDVAMTLLVDGHTFTPHVRTVAGTPVTIQFGSAPATWTIVTECSASHDGRVMTRSHVRYDNGEVAEPSLLLALGQPATVHIDADSRHPAIDMKLTVAASTETKS